MAVRIQYIGGPINSFFYGVDDKKCSKCQICIKNCPTKNIYLNKKNKVKSISISNSEEIVKYVKDDTYAVIIDEVQFLDEGIIKICTRLADSGIRVIVGGLDMDFRGEPFPIMSDLLARAEYVTKLKETTVMKKRIISLILVVFKE